MIAALAVALAVCWPMPVPAPVAVPYSPPACRWCAGHEAVGWTVPAGTSVSAVAPGRVVFAGRVADVGYVTVDVGDVRTTYGGLAQPRVRVGEVLAAGRLLGLVAGPASGLVTFSVRVGGVHVDPTPYFARLLGRARLVPTDGHRPRPWSAAESVCPARPAAR
jgi:murein DD-endopeptidase MepM/ murein hydrolase activator NlpD